MKHLTTVRLRPPLAALCAALLLAATGFRPAAAQTADVQIIHNSPYAAAAAVDVYVNGARALDDLGFREATSFLELPAGTPLTIDVTAPDAADNSSPVFSKTVTLETDATYLVVAAGDPAQATGDTAFDLFVGNGLTQAETAGNVAFTVFHGAPDAPAVDAVARGVGTLVDDLAFGAFAGDYLSVPPAAYDLDVATADGGTVVASFYAPLAGAADSALAVLASGFLTPAEGQPAFGLLAVYPSGTTALLPANTAAVQIIHNSPYAAAATVDVYVDGALAVDDLDFREATAFVDLPAGTTTGEGGTAPDLTIDVTAPEAADNSSPVFTKTLQLESGGTYIVVAAGDPTQTTGETAFDLFAAAGRTAADGDGEVALQIFHGAPDAPAVDVVVPAATRLTLADDLAFGAFEPYQSVAVADYPLNVETADNAAVAAVFEAPLETLGLGGAALVVVASGFLAPADGQPGFALAAALPAGGDLVLLPVTSGVAVEAPDEVPQTLVLHGNYPNPFNPSTTLQFDLPRDAAVSVAVFDVLGRQVLTLAPTSRPAGAGRTLRVDAGTLPSGTYLYRLTARMADRLQIETGRMTLLK